MGWDYVRTALGASDQGLRGRSVAKSSESSTTEPRRIGDSRSDGTEFELLSVLDEPGPELQHRNSHVPPMGVRVQIGRVILSQADLQEASDPPESVVRPAGAWSSTGSGSPRRST